MRRREFISLLGGAAATWSLAARGQQKPDRIRRIDVLHTPAADDPEGQARNAAFLQGLAQFGWTDGGNVRIETRWAAGDADRIRRFAAEGLTDSSGSGAHSPVAVAPALCSCSPSACSSSTARTCAVTNEMRRATLTGLLRKAGPRIRLSEHLDGADDTTLILHPCRMGLGPITFGQDRWQRP